MVGLTLFATRSQPRLATGNAFDFNSVSGSISSAFCFHSCSRCQSNLGGGFCFPNTILFLFPISLSKFCFSFCLRGNFNTYLGMLLCILLIWKDLAPCLLLPQHHYFQCRIAVNLLNTMNGSLHRTPQNLCYLQMAKMSLFKIIACTQKQQIIQHIIDHPPWCGVNLTQRRVLKTNAPLIPVLPAMTAP